MSDDMLALAARVEALDGADRIVDAEIAVAIDLMLPWDSEWGARRAAKHGGVERLAEMGDCHQNVWREHLPRYTASLDAAMGLVPVGRDWMLDNFDGPHDRRCSASVFNEPGALYEDFEAFAMSPALALCAASLRARASMGGE